MIDATWKVLVGSEKIIRKLEAYDDSSSSYGDLSVWPERLKRVYYIMSDLSLLTCYVVDERHCLVFGFRPAGFLSALMILVLIKSTFNKKEKGVQ